MFALSAAPPAALLSCSAPPALSISMNSAPASSTSDMYEIVTAVPTSEAESDTSPPLALPVALPPPTMLPGGISHDGSSTAIEPPSAPEKMGPTTHSCVPSVVWFRPMVASSWASSPVVAGTVSPVTPTPTTTPPAPTETTIASVAAPVPRTTSVANVTGCPSSVRSSNWKPIMGTKLWYMIASWPLTTGSARILASTAVLPLPLTSPPHVTLTDTKKRLGVVACTCSAHTDCTPGESTARRTSSRCWSPAAMVPPSGEYASKPAPPSVTSGRRGLSRRETPSNGAPSWSMRLSCTAATSTDGLRMSMVTSPSPSSWPMKMRTSSSWSNPPEGEGVDADGGSGDVGAGTGAIGGGDSDGEVGHAHSAASSFSRLWPSTPVSSTVARQ